MACVAGQSARDGLILVFITLQTDFCPRPALACKVTPHRGPRSSGSESVTPCLKPQTAQSDRALPLGSPLVTIKILIVLFVSVSRYSHPD